jgi:hypothetical protein
MSTFSATFRCEQIPITAAFENMRPLGNTRRRFPDQFRYGRRMPGCQVNSTYMNRKVFQLGTSSWLNLSIGGR